MRKEATPTICAACIAALGLSFADGIPDNLIDELKSEKFQAREQAEAELLDWSREDPEKSVALLLEQVRGADDPEVRQRSHNVLRALAMDEYMRDGEGFLGIQMVEVRAEIPGDDGPQNRDVIGITRVLRDTPASDAGLRVGDQIIAVNGTDLDTENALPSFQELIRGVKPGTEAALMVLRGDELIEVEATLTRRPPEQGGRFFGQQMMDMQELENRERERFFRRWLENLEN